MPTLQSCGSLSGDRLVGNAISLLGIAAANCPGGLLAAGGGGKSPAPPTTKPAPPPPPPPGGMCTLSAGLPIWDIVAGMPSLFDPLLWTTSISDLATEKLLTRKLSQLIDNFGLVSWSLRVDSETVIERDDSDEFNIFFGRASDAVNLVSQGLPDTAAYKPRTQGPLDFYRFAENLIDMDYSRLGAQCVMTATALKTVDWWSIAGIALPDEQLFQDLPEQYDIDQLDFPFDAIAGMCGKLRCAVLCFVCIFGFAFSYFCLWWLLAHSSIPPSATPQPDGTCKSGFFSLTDFLLANLDNSKMKTAATELAGLLRVWAQTSWVTANPASIVQTYVNHGEFNKVCPLIEGPGAVLAAPANNAGCYQDLVNVMCVMKSDANSVSLPSVPCIFNSA